MEPIGLDAATLRDWLESGRAVTVLDVRPAHQRAEWRIPGSVALDDLAPPGADAVAALRAVPSAPDTPVVAVCAEGKTSLIATLELRALGVAAYSLTGGMRGWSGAWNLAEVPPPGGGPQVVQVRRTGKGCLSYLVGSKGEAAVIDPALEPELYLEIATRRRWRIREVLDTHVHADHLSRARALAERAGATLHLPEQRRVHYDHHPLRDGDAVALGEVRLEALRVPGHTAESTAYLLAGKALFSGDTLFVDAVGRPDLAAADAGEARARAHALHASLRRLAALPGDTWVLPGHASAPLPFDGRPLMAALDEVRARVPLLAAPEEDFVAALLGRIPPPPANHLLIVRLNEAGMLPGGDATELEAGANRCAIG